MYTIEKDFSTKIYNSKIIKTEGRNFDINYSSILTKLIQECGRLCERFASDLFIIWNSIEQQLQEKNIETSAYLFGIRENGVDENVFIINRYDANGCIAMFQYRKIYRLDVVVEEDLIKMSLYEIERPYSEKKERQVE